VPSLEVSRTAAEGALLITVILSVARNLSDLFALQIPTAEPSTAPCALDCMCDERVGQHTENRCVVVFSHFHENVKMLLDRNPIPPIICPWLLK
jgi:hypothetical protein